MRTLMTGTIGLLLTMTTLPRVIAVDVWAMVGLQAPSGTYSATLGGKTVWNQSGGPDPCYYLYAVHANINYGAAVTLYVDGHNDMHCGSFGDECHPPCAPG